MIKTETENGLVHTWSDSGYYIHGGYPEADYPDAYDPQDENRTYTETATKIPATEATTADYEAALKKLGVINS